MRRALSLAVVALLLTACGEQGRIGGLVVLEGRHAIDPGTTVYGDILVLDGLVEIRPGARITGSAFVVEGHAVIAGQVDGDLAVVGGQVVLTDEAVIAGGLRRGGGEIDQADGASVGSTLVSPVAVDAIIALAKPPSEPEGLTILVVVQLVILGLLAAVAARLARPGIERMAEAVIIQPLVPLAVGVLGLVVGLSLLVFMVFTVVLIPVALLLAIGGVVGSGLGLASLGLVSVRRVLGPTSFGGRASVQAGIGSVTILGAAVLCSRVSLLGEMVIVVIAATALGTWLVTRFGTRRLVLERSEP